MFEGKAHLLTRAASFSTSITSSIFPIVNNHRGDSGKILRKIQIKYNFTEIYSKHPSNNLPPHPQKQNWR